MSRYGHAVIGEHGLLNADRTALEHIKRQGVRAAMLGYHNAPAIHYSQGPDRWEGIAQHLRSYKGQFPHHADCSSFVTWVLWDATRRYPAARKDFVNDLRWTGGHTGTLVQQGREVSLSRLRILDLVFYGDEGWRPGHVAIYVGDGKVVSHGSEGGPYFIDVQYRSDVARGGWAPRRYLH